MLIVYYYNNYYKNNSIIGAYISNFSTSSGGNKGVGDKNDFIF